MTVRPCRPPPDEEMGARSTAVSWKTVHRSPATPSGLPVTTTNSGLSR
jgi:hypothetical protein